jgi:crotonobetainyl-CoA:carnitine CoA-transferase CaiB-like acyl-CoA transferase
MRAVLYLYLNTNKRGIAVDLERPEGRALLARLASGADAVVHDVRPRRSRVAASATTPCAR